MIICVNIINLYNLDMNDENIANAQTSRPSGYGFVATVIFFLGILAAISILFLRPIPASWILKTANPAMITLAKRAGMSRQGELIFLQSDPKVVSDTQMEQYCAGNAASNNRNGFIEQGCYVPNSYNPTTGHIYIRQMPTDLYDQEVVTAAYEMLHAVYFKWTVNGQQSQLVQMIENNYKTTHNQSLEAQVANFAKTEPGYRDLELFSLLGTEYLNLSSGLSNFYAPYFSNRNLTITSFTKTKALFQNYQLQLQQLQSDITRYDNLANKAYSGSVAWARVGNAREDTYDYNIYKEYVSLENTAINQYNSLVSDYNALVTEYNGSQPVNSMSTVTTAKSK